jgi:electron transport complex protein RnfG
MSHDIRHVITSALLLALFGVAGAGLVALVFDNTEERIEANIRAQLLKSLNEIMPSERYDNDIANDTTQIWNADLNPGKGTTIYRARKNGKPVAAIFNITAAGGYGGPIRLLVGINHDGSLAGVRVVEQHETPGLGDKIEPEKSDWLQGFVGKSLDNPNVQNWKVKRDGGAFDQFTGATITPRAVVKGIKNTLLYYSENSDAVFETLKPKEKQANE